ncbi:MAG TPA: enoyl-CoA hydratase/isomerase family protein [Albitalea sp.]|nr:enoyl-CoA hydratase/isomerase family protein [Albitalea sp.]
MSAATASPVQASRAGAVGVIELARPDKFNCLSMAAFRGIEAALDDFERAGSGVRSVLIRAQGKHFCTGADLDEVKSLRGDPQQLAQFIALGHRVLARLEASELPVIGACQGLVLAGGSELILACDVIFAAGDFRIGDQHAQYGLIPGWGGSQRLPRIVGVRRALDLFFSARWIDAATALQWGLVNHVVEPDKLGEASLDYCTKLATRSRGGIATMKRLARRGIELPLAEGLKLEQDEATIALLGDDVGEGLAAFEARRAPQFKD